MYLFNDPKLKERRRFLRNNSTQAEKSLWYRLKSNQLQYKFRRQHGIGPYIVDFYCPEKRLAIEIDGGQHADGKSKAYDARRTMYLNESNITVLRFWNSEVLASIDDVVKAIHHALQYLPHSPS